MKTLEIFGANKFGQYSKERIGCRGILIKDSRILLVHELKTDLYMIPGGGWEAGESFEECCIRELQEETGYVVVPCSEGAFLQLDEYYEEYRYVGYYYKCEITGTADTNLTEAEKQGELVSEWVDFTEAMNIFSKHNDYASTFEEKRGAYLREYSALQVYQDIYSIETGDKL